MQTVAPVTVSVLFRTKAYTLDTSALPFLELLVSHDIFSQAANTVYIAFELQ